MNKEVRFTAASVLFLLAALISLGNTLLNTVRAFSLGAEAAALSNLPAAALAFALNMFPATVLLARCRGIPLAVGTGLVGLLGLIRSVLSALSMMTGYAPAVQRLLLAGVAGDVLQAMAWILLSVLALTARSEAGERAARRFCLLPGILYLLGLLLAVAVDAIAAYLMREGAVYLISAAFSVAFMVLPCVGMFLAGRWIPDPYKRVGDSAPAEMDELY